MIRRFLFGRSIKQTTKEILKEKALTLTVAVIVYGGMHLYERRQERKRKEKEERSSVG